MHQRLHGFVARRVNNPADVDDLVQDIFVRIHERIATVEQADRVHAWAYQIARNVISDYYRERLRHRERPATEAELDIPVELDDDDGSAASELAHCLAPIMARLPESYRQAVELTEIHGMTQAAAASQLDLSVSGMKSRVQRGRRQMKELLLDCCQVAIDRRGGVIDYEVQQPACTCCASCST
jgi:RNA polymerase sigma-70 factor (ECF subfamily)